MLKIYFAMLVTTSFINARAESEPSKIVILGDSLTEGYGVERELAFTALLEKSLRLEFHRTTVVNMGIRGATSASGPARWKWVMKVNPQVLVLALGANDGLRGLPVDKMRENLATVIKAAKEQRIRTLLVGMKAPPNMGSKYTRQFESVFSELAKQYQVPFMPFLLIDVAGDPKLNLKDGVHPNAEGHAVIAKNLKPYLLPLLKEETHAQSH